MTEREDPHKGTASILIGGYCSRIGCQNVQAKDSQGYYSCAVLSPTQVKLRLEGSGCDTAIVHGQSGTHKPQRGFIPLEENS